MTDVFEFINCMTYCYRNNKNFSVDFKNGIFTIHEGFIDFNIKGENWKEKFESLKRVCDANN